MKLRRVLLIGAAVLLADASAGIANAEPTDAERAAQSRELIKGFAQRLQGELKAAMAAGGPERAIPVCHTAAPAITRDKAAEKGWSVGRTALKLRNPANAPDPWERSVLEAFQEQLAQGADPATLERYETTMQNGRRVFRYMKAIPTQKACLTCHGPDVKASLRKQITELYPQDQAVGFQLGELRGAFTIVQPLE